jgi:hypothetical protein
MKNYGTPFLALLATCISSAHAFADSPHDFEEPVVLRVGDDVLNSNGRLRYPSPVIIDVDGDGKKELVVGTISGFLSACENENNSDGEPIWSEPKQIETIEGKPLKFHNW